MAHDTAIRLFIKASKKSPQLKLLRITPEEHEHMMDLFLQIHNVPNDPTNREENALKKAKLIKDLAKNAFDISSEEKKERVKVELISSVDSSTKTLTHNVQVTLGNSSNGSNVLLMVHHDTIAAEDYSLAFQPINESNELVGQTIQDNTIHVAAALSILGKLVIPDRGAISIIFTDHEENGCRGSSSMTGKLLQEIDLTSPLILLANESTNQKLALGHRGKYSAELIEKIQDGHVANTFFSFYQTLVTAQNRAWDESSRKSILGQTAGSSTYGFIDEKNTFAKLDFRTNDFVTPNKVESIWQEAIRYKKLMADSEILQNAKKFMEKGFCDLKITEAGIMITSISEAFHPSVFNPKKDETTMPAVYLALKAMEEMGLAKKVTQIDWGEKTKQNSNPMWAVIAMNTTNLSKKKMLNAMKDVKAKKEVVSKSGFKFALDNKKTIKTPCVVSPKDDVVNKITRQLGEQINQKVELTTMNFMTDIAKLFALAKKRGQKTYGFVYGVGFPKLHGIERVTVEESILIQSAMRAILPIMHEAISD